MRGASNGAAVGFLISTPQTGVDSILVSASFLGWPFALFKVFSALVTGLVGGWLTNRVDPPTESINSDAEKAEGTEKILADHRANMDSSEQAHAEPRAMRSPPVSAIAIPTRQKYATCSALASTAGAPFT